jgi:hypothetical protein
MRALCWMGINGLQVTPFPAARIVNACDAVLKVRLTTTCGSDLHLIDGYIPTMRRGRRHRPRIHGRGRRSRRLASELGRVAARAPGQPPLRSSVLVPEPIGSQR